MMNLKKENKLHYRRHNKNQKKSQEHQNKPVVRIKQTAIPLRATNHRRDNSHPTSQNCRNIAQHHYHTEQVFHTLKQDLQPPTHCIALHVFDGPPIEISTHNRLCSFNQITNKQTNKQTIIIMSAHNNGCVKNNDE